MLSLILIIALSALYAGMIVYFTLGVLRTGKHPRTGQPSVSIVVPLHNEQDHALKALNALESQEYEGDWEVICVNDRSTDQTPQLLEDFVQQHKRFTVLHIPLDAPPLPSPKKRALEVGFAQARYDVLMTMDADCTPGKKWLKSMASCFVDRVGIVQGSKRNTGKNTLLYAYQRLDTLGLTLIEAAGFSNGTPMVASAAALAYRKDLFYDVGGFSDLMDFTSGDDDMLVHKMIQKPISFCYNMDPEATVETEPVHSWKALINQRARWSSNGTNYQSLGYIFFLTLIYTFYAWLFLSPWLVLGLGFPLWWALGPALTKLFVDALFLTIGGMKLKTPQYVLWLPLVEIIQIPLISLAVPLGTFFKRFRWH